MTEITEYFTTTSLTTPLDTTECEPIEFLETFGRVYGEMHGYITLFLCPICVLSNICIVIVLNQRSMISPTNFLLTSLAISDGLLMIFYIPFASYFLIGRHTRNSSYSWAVFLQFHINLQNFLHLTSSYIVVVIAVFRILYVRFLVQCHILCSMQRAKLAITLVLIISSILTIPCVITHHIVRNNNENEENGYMVTYKENEVMLNYLYWNTAIFSKLLPLLCLSVLSFMLIFTVRKQNSRMRRMKAQSKIGRIHAIAVKSPSNLSTTMTNASYLLEKANHADNDMKNNNTNTNTINNNNNNNNNIMNDNGDTVIIKLSSLKESPSSSSTAPVSATTTTLTPTPTPNANRERKSKTFENERDKVENRLTKFLLTIVFIFMITLLPQAILLFLSGFLGNCFTDTVYNALGDFMDLLTIVNNGINFILYCSMSHQFRTTFIHFCTKIFPKYR
uniref:G-protein coupled receptors family 1 profile domain-containing protein n=1 Tax=Trichobilharzia regenti TaxID=157069 RepID=A0AA85K4U7_TRIRE|nr:unnamed protein product [Trichobilharzia regenti]